MGAPALGVWAWPPRPCAWSEPNMPAAASKTAGILLFLAKALVDSLDKGVPLSVARIVVERRLGRDHLLEGLVLLDQVLNTVANDGHHVAVVGDIGGIAQPPVPGN